jgi:hypothetical protein
MFQSKLISKRAKLKLYYTVIRWIVTICMWDMDIKRTHN